MAGETTLVTITFCEPVAGFNNADLTIANGTLSPVESTDGGRTWTSTVTRRVNLTNASNLITLNTSGVTDAAGNTGNGTVTSTIYTIDTLQPTAASITLGSSTIRAGETTTVTIVFSEAVIGFTTDDLDVQGGSGAHVFDFNSVRESRTGSDRPARDRRQRAAQGQPSVYLDR